MINGFEIFGVSIKFYGILMAVGFIVGLIFAIKFAKQKGYKSSLPYDLILIVFPSAIIGARLNYVLFTLDRGWTFLEVLQIWNGGLMIYGGVLFAVGAIAIYCAVKKISFVKILDMLAPCLIIGQAIGRWGNFFNQEAYGSLITNPSFQWFPFGVYIESGHFTSEAAQQVLEFFGTTAVDGAWFNATFFYESMWCLIGFILLYFIYTKTNKVGLTTASYFVFYGTERFFVEMLRTDSLYLGPIKISVLISLILVISGIVWLTILLIKGKKQKQQKPEIAQEAVEVDTGQPFTLEDLQSEVKEQKELDEQNNQQSKDNFDEDLPKDNHLLKPHQTEIEQEISLQHDLPESSKPQDLPDENFISDDVQNPQQTDNSIKEQWSQDSLDPILAELKIGQVWHKSDVLQDDTQPDDDNNKQ